MIENETQNENEDKIASVLSVGPTEQLTANVSETTKVSKDIKRTVANTSGPT